MQLHAELVRLESLTKLLQYSFTPFNNVLITAQQGIEENKLREMTIFHKRQRT